jgi:hypothetical protein
MAKAKTISLSVWKTLFRDTLTAFSKVWWRIASVNIFTMLTLIIGTGIFAGVGYLAFRNTLENIIANFSFGGAFLVGIIPVILLVAVWAMFVTVFSANGKIANTIVLKNYVKKKTRSSFKIYFVDAWHYLWRQIIISLHVVWYLAWPVILVMGVWSILMTLVTALPTFVGIIFMMLAGLLFLWRVMHVVFMKSTLVHFDKDSKSTFKAMIKLVKRNWWGVLFSIISFFIVVNIVRAVFLVPEYIIFPGEDDFNIFLLLDGLFSFFVLAPLLISFMYLFMLHLSKTRKIKP